MTMMVTFCSQIILQKSSLVDGIGPAESQLSRKPQTVKVKLALSGDVFTRSHVVTLHDIIHRVRYTSTSYESVPERSWH